MRAQPRGVEPVQQGERLCAARRVADDVEVGLGLEEREQSTAHDGVIVDDHDPDRLSSSGQLRAHDGALPRRAGDRQPRVDLGGTRAHRLQPEVPGMVRIGVEAAAVVADLEHEAAGQDLQPDPRRGGLGVLDGVRRAPRGRCRTGAPRCAPGARGRRPARRAGRRRRPARRPSRRAAPARARDHRPADRGPARRSARASRSGLRASGPRSCSRRGAGGDEGSVPEARSDRCAIRVCRRVENSACETESCRSRAIRWRSSTVRSPSRSFASVNAAAERSRSQTTALRISVVRAVTAM